MKNSPLQLIRYVVPEASCTATPTFDPKKPIEGRMIDQFSVSVTVTKQNAPEKFPGRSWSVEMSVSQTLKEGQNFPYQFKVSLVGFFACPPNPPPDFDEERFVRVNGSSMLYGAAREIIRSLTARGPWKELFIPGISFYENNARQKDQPPPVTKAQ